MKSYKLYNNDEIFGRVFIYIIANQTSYYLGIELFGISN